jgi:SAM-dependent methyltransferase
VPVYSDDAVAALYDVLCPWVPSDDFYLSLVARATAVLDVGCGTGQILYRARTEGHSGRLSGLDPDESMLKVARRRAANLPQPIEWVLGPAASMMWQAEFDLAIMSGHAFQCLVTDAEISDSLLAIRRALASGGRFVFDTRNPAVKPWENWHPGNAQDVVDPDGLPVRVSHRVETVADGVVTMTETTSDRQDVPLRVDRGVLRFVEVPELAGFLDQAGFTIEAQYGDWQSSLLAPGSREIITTAAAR